MTETKLPEHLISLWDAVAYVRELSQFGGGNRARAKLRDADWRSDNADKESPALNFEGSAHALKAIQGYCMADPKAQTHLRAWGRKKGERAFQLIPSGDFVDAILDHRNLKQPLWGWQIVALDRAKLYELFPVPFDATSPLNLASFYAREIEARRSFAQIMRAMAADPRHSTIATKPAAPDYTVTADDEPPASPFKRDRYPDIEAWAIAEVKKLGHGISGEYSYQEWGKKQRPKVSIRATIELYARLPEALKRKPGAHGPRKFAVE